MNKSKHRRELRDANRVKGPSGSPHPFGSRANRRSKEGKEQFDLMLEKILAQRELGLAKDDLVNDVHTHPMNEEPVNAEG